jgi:hypothetical protein
MLAPNDGFAVMATWPPQLICMQMELRQNSLTSLIYVKTMPRQTKKYHRQQSFFLLLDDARRARHRKIIPLSFISPCVERGNQFRWENTLDMVHIMSLLLHAVKLTG